MSFEESEDAGQVKYPVSVKLTPTAKGYRITVHCYGMSPAEAVSANMETLRAQKEALTKANEKLAPMEGGEKE